MTGLNFRKRANEVNTKPTLIYTHYIIYYIIMHIYYTVTCSV